MDMCVYARMCMYAYSHVCLCMYACTCMFSWANMANLLQTCPHSYRHTLQWRNHTQLHAYMHICTSSQTLRLFSPLRRSSSKRAGGRERQAGRKREKESEREGASYVVSHVSGHDIKIRLPAFPCCFMLVSIVNT